MIRRAGEHARLVEVAAGQHPADVAAALKQRWPDALTDVVPGHDTVLAVWNNAPPEDAEIAALTAGAGESLQRAQEPEVVIPVTYDGADLATLAATLDLSVEALIVRHTAARYRVGFLGFLPGFAYLLGDDPLLEVPRHAEPRPSVPAGSIALGGTYCAVYPRASPGGWQLIGTTTLTLFDPSAEPPALLTPGAAVRFEAVAP